MKKVHCIFNRINHEVIDSDDYEIKIKDVKPRTPDEVWVPPADLRERPPWTVDISVFSSYCVDSEKLLTKCFEFD